MLNLGEQDLAAAQLDEIVPAKRSEADWKDAVLTWHLEAVAKARAEAWIPGLAPSSNISVRETISRHQDMGMTIGRLNSENLELQRQLVDAIACLRFYEIGVTDNGERARSTLSDLGHAKAAMQQTNVHG